MVYLVRGTNAYDETDWRIGNKQSGSSLIL